MKVRVLAFAGVKAIVGDAETEVELPEGSSVSDLCRVLEERYADLGAYWERIAIAVDGQLGQETLREGSEVALLPPVSGGSDTSQVLVDGPIDIDSVIEEVAARGRGAVLTFQGVVRDSHLNRPVTHLVYDAYRSMAEQVLRSIATDLEARDNDLRVQIVHRLGEVPAGEASVIIATASPHRDAAYRASREALERLKKEVPIWKHEHYADGEAEWREEEPLGSTTGPAARV